MQDTNEINPTQRKKSKIQCSNDSIVFRYWKSRKAKNLFLGPDNDKVGNVSELFLKRICEFQKGFSIAGKHLNII